MTDEQDNDIKLSADLREFNRREGLLVKLDRESNDIIESVDPIHRNTLINHAIKTFYKSNFFPILYQESKKLDGVLDNTHLNQTNETSVDVILGNDISLNQNLSTDTRSDTLDKPIQKVKKLLVF